MKIIATYIFLLSAALFVRQSGDTLDIPGTSKSISLDQQIQLAQSSFSPLYLHVFEKTKSGPAKHLNLTNQMKDEVMRVTSFKLLKDKGITKWIVYLKRENDKKTYVCEIKEAIISKEIIILDS